MNFIKRGFASITRRKGKSIILFAVIFVLGNVIAGAISIQQATKSVETNIKKELGGKATVGMDEKAFNELSDEEMTSTEMKELTVKDVEAMGALPSVKYYDYSVEGGAQTEKLKMYTTEDSDEQGGMMFDENSLLKNNFSYKGINYADMMDIKENKIKLVDGRVFKAEEIKDGKAVAVISKKMAELNNLKLGDKMVVDRGAENYMNMGMGDEGKEDKDNKIYFQKDVFEIIGLFEPTTKDKKKDKESNNNGGMLVDDSDIYNVIYAPNKVISEGNKTFQMGMYNFFPDMKAEIESMLKENNKTLEESLVDYIKPTFILNSPDDSEAFKQEATALLPDKYSKIILATDQYDSIAGPVKNMSKMATYVIYISVIATILIISLVVLLFLRDRKHELGIYLSLGEKRGKVLGQILLEVLTIALVAITLSVFTGNVLAKGVSNSLITTQLTAKEDDGDMNGEDYDLMELTGNGIDKSDVADSYQVSLTPGYIGLFYAVGLGTILISTVVPLIYILRLNPKKIMM